MKFINKEDSSEQFPSLDEYLEMLEEQGVTMSKDGFLCYLLLISQIEGGYTFDELENYLEASTLSGTLIAPNGEQAKLVTGANSMINADTSFESYCYQYPINQNGEYTFTFYGDDGSYGQIVLKIDEENPQLVTYDSFDSYAMMLMLGINNWGDIQEASFDFTSMVNFIVDTEETEPIDLTPYLSMMNIEGLPKNVKGINFSIVPDIENNSFGEVICKYNGKEIKRKLSIIIPI